MRRLTVLLTMLSILAVVDTSAAPGRRLFLNVISPPLAYSDSQVDTKLVRLLTRESNMSVSIVDQEDPVLPVFPVDYHNTDSLLEWGREAGGRYVMVVEVTSQRLERRKSFHLPLVFHKYETVGVIEGEFRLLDLTRSRLLAAEPFKVERKGSRIFQATMDDDINDPDLHLTAPAKVRFFDQLEENLCQHLAQRVGSLAGNH